MVVIPYVLSLNEIVPLYGILRDVLPPAELSGVDEDVT